MTDAHVHFYRLSYILFFLKLIYFNIARSMVLLVSEVGSLDQRRTVTFTLNSNRLFSSW